jgi:hypothetical protein
MHPATSLREVAPGSRARLTHTMRTTRCAPPTALRMRDAVKGYAESAGCEEGVSLCIRVGLNPAAWSCARSAGKVLNPYRRTQPSTRIGLRSFARTEFSHGARGGNGRLRRLPGDNSLPEARLAKIILAEIKFDLAAHRPYDRATS